MEELPGESIITRITVVKHPLLIRQWSPKQEGSEVESLIPCFPPPVLVYKVVGKVEDLLFSGV